jgi:ribosomal protein L2
VPLRRKGGRNHTGRIVNRWVGGGHKRRLRIVDFHRTEDGEHDVVRIEYDPGRSAHIALIKRRGAGGGVVDAEEGARLAELESEDGTAKGRHEVRGGWSYILAPEGVRAGSVVRSFRSGIPQGFVEGWNDDPATPQSVTDPTSTSSRALGILRTQTLKPGNVLPLNLLPAGTICHSLSLTPSGRMQLCRAAGSFAQIVAHHGPTGEALGGGEVLNMVSSMGLDGSKRKAGTVLVKLQSGEVRRLQPDCVAVVGTVSK